MCNPSEKRRYAAVTSKRRKAFQTILKGFSPLSGYQDSNLGPPAPKAGALTGLRYTPNHLLFFSKAVQRYAIHRKYTNRY